MTSSIYAIKNKNYFPRTILHIQSKSAPVSNSNLTKGDSGQAVKELQKTLQAKGQTANPDGTFGIETEGAVKNVQSNHGLSVDGIVGPATKIGRASCRERV